MDIKNDVSSAHDAKEEFHSNSRPRDGGTRPDFISVSIFRR